MFPESTCRSFFNLRNDPRKSQGCQLTLENVSLRDSIDQLLLIMFTPVKAHKKQWCFLRQSMTPLHNFLFLPYNPYLNHIHPFSYVKKAFFTSNIIEQ